MLCSLTLHTREPTEFLTDEMERRNFAAFNRMFLNSETIVRLYNWKIFMSFAMTPNYTTSSLFPPHIKIQNIFNNVAHLNVCHNSLKMITEL